MSFVISADESSEFSLIILPGGSPVSRSFFTEHLNKSLSWAGLPTTIYRGHSLRIGRATTGAMAGVSAEDIQCMGKWKSQAFTHKDSHVKTCIINVIPYT